MQCEKVVKKERAARAAAVAEKMRGEYLSSCVGKSFRVLFETGSGSGSSGHAENYCEVRVDDEGLCGQIRETCIVGVSDGVLLGQLCQNQA